MHQNPYDWEIQSEAQNFFTPIYIYRWGLLSALHILDPFFPFLQWYFVTFSEMDFPLNSIWIFFHIPDKEPKLMYKFSFSLKFSMCMFVDMSKFHCNVSTFIMLNLLFIQPIFNWIRISLMIFIITVLSESIKTVCRLTSVFESKRLNVLYYAISKHSFASMQ